MKESEKKKLAIKLIASELSQPELSDVIGVLRGIREGHNGLNDDESIPELVMCSLSHDEIGYLLSDPSESVYKGSSDFGWCISKALGFAPDKELKNGRDGEADQRTFEEVETDVFRIINGLPPVERRKNKPSCKSPKIAFTLTNFNNDK